MALPETNTLAAFKQITNSYISNLILLFVGIARIVQGIRNKDAPGWSRSFMVGVGVLSIAVSLLGNTSIQK
jgi:uncharacterized membrane protein HdeD (DUF308 family)